MSTKQWSTKHKNIQLMIFFLFFFLSLHLRLDQLQPFCAGNQDKFNQLLSLLPDLREMAQRGEVFLYFKHMQGNAPTQTLLMEMLHAKKR